MTDERGLPEVGELFALLGNETRMALIRALWDRLDFVRYVTGHRTGTSYSDLLAAVPTDDSGNVNYHLQKLDGVLVDRREDGYVLTPLGYNLMREIERYDDYEYRTVEEWTVAEPCPFCDGDLGADYRREVLSVRCRDCGGLGEDGNFTFVQLPSSAAADRTRSDLLDVATRTMFEKVRASLHGTCWDCHAPMDRTVECCDEHDLAANGICRNCSHRYRTRIDATCSECGTRGRGPMLEYAIVTPGVAAAYDEVGLGPTSAGPWRYRLTALGDGVESVPADEDRVAELSFDRAGIDRVVEISREDEDVVIEAP